MIGKPKKNFKKRVKEAKAKGICVFRDDNNREFILDIIDDYMDVCDALDTGKENSK